MYVKHLLTDRGIPVHDRRTGAIGFFDEPTILSLIKTGIFQPVGNRRAIHEIRNVGPTLWKLVTLAEELAGYKPSEARPTKYSHNRETSDNPANVWTLIRLSKRTRGIFTEVVTNCIAPFFDPDLKR